MNKIDLVYPYMKKDKRYNKYMYKIMHVKI